MRTELFSSEWPFESQAIACYVVSSTYQSTSLRSCEIGADNETLAQDKPDYGQDEYPKVYI